MSRRTRPSHVSVLLGLVSVGVGVAIGRIAWPAPPAVWTEPPVAAAPQTLPSLAPIIKETRDSVVGVRCIRQLRPALDGAGIEPPRVVDGTGFVIHDSGLVVTNHHIVANHERILVEVPGHRAVDAVLVGEDPVTDIAVVRFSPPPEGVRALSLADSREVEQGDWVLAMGNPFRYRQTVTVGIVSYVGRHIPEAGLQVSNEYLQFSAPVHHGSSGGPLLDMQGHVVGVTTAAHASGNGISFAVPSKVLKWVLTTMDHGDGRVRRGFLGMGLEPLDAMTAARLGVTQGCGALVGSVEVGRAAHAAGVRSGDVVVTYNGRIVPDAYELFDWITYSTPGEPAVIEVVRSGERLPALVAKLEEVQVRPGTPPEIVPSNAHPSQ